MMYHWFHAIINLFNQKYGPNITNFEVFMNFGTKHWNNGAQTFLKHQNNGAKTFLKHQNNGAKTFLEYQNNGAKTFFVAANNRAKTFFRPKKILLPGPVYP